MYFTAREAADSVPVNNGGFSKEWPFLKRQVEVDPAYRNKLI